MSDTMTRRALLAGVSAAALLADAAHGAAAPRGRRGLSLLRHGPHEPTPTVRVHNYGRSPVAHAQVSFFQPLAPGDLPNGRVDEVRKRGSAVVLSQQNQESSWKGGGSKGAAFSFV